MAEEIEELRNRLKLVENAIGELKQQDLAIVKSLAEVLFFTGFSIGIETLRGEDRKRYGEVWLEKVKVARGKVGDSKTSGEALDIINGFLSELIDYYAAAKVDTADKAMEIAHSFIKKYSPVALPLKAVKEKDVWLVDIDVGALAVKVAKVKVDARTGDILSYEIPEKK